jgi:3-oxoacyl-[acyl-carrier protein] reductase
VPATSIISGGSRGLGLAIVERLLRRGDRVATFARHRTAAIAELEGAFPGALLFAACDAADPAALRRFVSGVVERFGRVDGCVANAAAAHDGVLATARDDEIDEMLAVNLGGAIVLVRECVRQMLVQPRGDDAGGRSVVLVSSTVASRGSPGLATYAATKAGLEGFARSLARELGPRGIRVNAVAPGFLETDLSSSLSLSARSRIAARTPLARLGTPGEVAAAVEFLTGLRSAFVTGQVIAVDGGA